MNTIDVALQYHLQGDIDRAKALYHEMLLKSPHDFNALHLLGVLLWNEGLLDEADKLVRDALKVSPAEPAAWSNLGAIQTARGHAVLALDSLDRAISLQPDSVEALNNRTVALLALRRFSDALLTIDRALELKPDNAEALNNRGAALRGLKRLDEAADAFSRTLSLRPANVEAETNLGQVLQETGRYEEALACFDRALALAPEKAVLHVGRANALRALRCLDDALESCDLAIALGERSDDAHFVRGVTLRDLGRSEDALRSFDLALAALSTRPAQDDSALTRLNSDLARVHDSRGVVLSEMGRLAEAETAFLDAINAAPQAARSFYGLSLIRRFAPADPQMRAMSELLNPPEKLSIEDQVFLHFAAAKAFADTGDFEASFNCLSAGSALNRTRQPYDEAAERAAFSGAKRIDRDVFARNAGLGDPTTVPVFVLGMPRSGTTLIEQILSSHPDVFGAGETEAFPEAVTAAGETLEDPGSLDFGHGLASLGRSYLLQLEKIAPSAARIVDKLPGNFLHVGLIRLALPNARIIHVRRDPFETCMSCYFNLFSGGLRFSYDLRDLGRYYRAYDELMAHWRHSLPEAGWLEVRYEDVVTDLENQTRRMLAYCGLEWDPRCLDFHKSTRDVRTASVAQVRRPVYTSSVSRWAGFLPYVRPLIDELELLFS